MKLRVHQTYSDQDSLTVGLPHDYPGQQVIRIELSASPVNSYGIADNLIAQFDSPVTLKAEINFFAPDGGDLSELAPWVEALEFEPPELMASLLMRHLGENGYQVRRVRGILANGQPHSWLEVWKSGHWYPLDPWAYHQLFREPGALLAMNTAPHYTVYLGSHEGRRLALSFGEVETTLPQTRVQRYPFSGWLSLLRSAAFVGLGLAALGYPPQGWLVWVLYGLYLGMLTIRQGRGWLELLRHTPSRAFEPLFFHGFALSLLGVPNAGLGLGFLGIWAYFRWPRRFRPAPIKVSPGDGERT